MTPRTWSSNSIGARSIDSSRSSSVPGIVSARGSCEASGRYLGDPAGGDPAGDPDADLDPELLGRLVDVLADLAPEGDRHEIVADDPVDAHVVVVDELLELGRDRHPDLALAGQPVEPVAELLDRLELRRPGGHPGDVGRRRRAVGRRHSAPRCAAVRSGAPASALRATVDRSPRQPAAPSPDRAALGGVEEALQVADPVPPVTARIDPVIAQSTLIAPRPNGVRVNAEQSGRLGHREGCIRRAVDEQCGQAS